MSDGNSPEQRSGDVQGSTIPLPAFIHDPLVLDPEVHADAALLPGLGYYGFSVSTWMVPLTMTEFQPAARHYPIVLSSDASAAPAAVLGFPDGLNQYLEGNGNWREGAHVPTWLRLYPFFPSISGDGMVRLGVDRACLRFQAACTDRRAELLFDERGEPTVFAMRVLQRCEQLARDWRATGDWSRALHEDRQLLHRSSRDGLRCGEDRRMHDFHLIDPCAHRDLPVQRLVVWQRNGWLLPTALQLASQHNWQSLRRRAVRLGQGTVSESGT